MASLPEDRPNPRTLIGIVALMALLTAYSLLVMALFAGWMSDQAIWLQTAFYIVAGFAWLPPAYWLIRWMAAPRARARASGDVEPPHPVEHE